MKVPLLDLRAQHESLRDELLAAMQRVMDTQQFELEISERRRLPLIEDAAQAIGSEDRGHAAGSMGMIGCFSFYPTKNLGGAGNGGLLTTNDEKLSQRLRALRVHGGATEYHHLEVGINSRLDSLQAAVLRVKLKHLDGWCGERQKRAQRYTELFAEAKLEFELVPPFIRPNARHIFHQYVVRVPQLVLSGVGLFHDSARP